jgi:hypothetical protein
MGEPVIFDDGGSTRIKQLIDNANMDGLVDDGHVANATGAFMSIPTVAAPIPVPACVINIVFLGKTASASTPLGDAGPGNVAAVLPITMKQGDRLVVNAGLSHRVTALLEAFGNLKITISGTDPVVDARHKNRRRRYIVSNAPAISDIVYNPATAGVPSTTFKVPNATTLAEVVYTAVSLSDAV